MKIYNPDMPLIFSHVPKTGGTSVRNVFDQWFAPNLLPHYAAGQMPEKHDLNHPKAPGKPVLVYGHFNKDRGFGIDDYYPDVCQCISIFRDPWERIISGYFFKVANVDKWPAFKKVAAMDLEQFLSGWPFEDPVFGPPLDRFLPDGMTLKNYRDVLENRFVAVGITEKLPESLSRIAEALGLEFDPDSLSHINTAPRTREVPEFLKAGFVERNPLEYAIYNFACEKVG